MSRPNRPWFRKGRGWCVKIRGRMHNLGVTGEHQEELATAAFIHLLAKLGLSAVPAPAPAPPGKHLGTLRTEYLNSVKHRVRPKTLVDLADRLLWLVKRFPGPVTDLDPVAVEQAAASESWGRGTVRQTLQVCQAFVRWCGRKEFTLRVPPAQYRGHECLISREEYQRAVSVAIGDYGPFLRFLWATGCRPGEARAVTAERVDWLNGVVRLDRWKNDKTGKPRLILLSPSALEVLEGQRAKYGRGHLFRGSQGVPFSIHGINRRWRDVKQKAGLSVPTVCAFRHAFVTRALEAGESAATVAALVGTSVTMIEKTYSHVSANTSRLKGVAGRLDQAG